LNKNLEKNLDFAGRVEVLEYLPVRILTAKFCE
jgi:hypothetical protein